MTVAMFLTLFAAFATATGLVVQGIKSILDEHGKTYSSNLLACIVGCVIGIGGTAVYYVLTAIPFDTTNVVFMILMGGAVALGAMVGYDKIVQMVKQFHSTANGNNDAISNDEPEE